MNDHAVPTDVAYEHEAIADAPAAVVWDVLTDHAGYASWSLLPTSRVVRAGDESGVGAVRFLGLWRVGATEEVVSVQSGRRMVYRIVSGVPAASYRGEVVLEPIGQARTRVVWRGGVARGPRPLRRAYSRLLGMVPRRLLHGVVRAAEARTK